MFTILMIILIVVSVLIMVVVLMQSSKGTGLSGAFGGASGMGTVFGVRRTADFLSRATWVLGLAFVVLCLAINLFFLPKEATQESIIRRSASEEPLPATPISAPQQQGGQQQAPPPQGQPAPAQQAPAQQQPQR